jgi:endonuclease-3
MAKPLPKLGRRLKPAEAEALFAKLAAHEPDPRTELEYVNPYTLLVAVVLSAQATDRGVNLATKPLFARVKTPEAMVKLGEAELAQYIKTIGLWRGKAHNVIALSKQLIEHHQGKVPDNREALEALPGVGRKTANVVLMEIFDQPTIAVDTHVFRVSNRTGLARGTTPEAVEAQLEKIVPDPFKRGAHHWLILHGRYTCVAQKPKCPNCVIAEICTYPAKTQEPVMSSAPARAPRRRTGSARA